MSAETSLLPVARVFDAEDDSGQPYFSPDRWRVMAGDERARLLGYLSNAPWGLVARGLDIDALDPSRGYAVPIGFHSDGVWVWEVASEYYLETMGAAPEDALVAHIQAAGYMPPTDLPGDVATAASHAVTVVPPPFPAEGRRGLRYFAHLAGSRSPNDPGGLLRTWRMTVPNGAEVSIWQAHGRDGHWHDTTAPPSPSGGADEDLVEISAREAAAVIDHWWAVHHS